MQGNSLARLPVASLLLAVVLSAAAACGDGGEDPGPDAVYHTLLGGETTAFTAHGNAFELSARNLPQDLRRIFEVGDSFFTQNWVAAPSSTEARDGLGPTHNAASCSSCHSHDGRAKPPDYPDDSERGLLLRLSIPAPTAPPTSPRTVGSCRTGLSLVCPLRGES